MGGHQGVEDERPYFVAFACRTSPPREWCADTEDRVEQYMSMSLRTAPERACELILGTARMFADASGVNVPTAVALAYTMHVAANWRPI